MLILITCSFIGVYLAMLVLAKDYTSPARTAEVKAEIANQRAELLKGILVSKYKIASILIVGPSMLVLRITSFLNILFHSHSCLSLLHLAKHIDLKYSNV